MKKLMILGTMLAGLTVLGTVKSAQAGHGYSGYSYCGPRNYGYYSPSFNHYRYHPGYSSFSLQIGRGHSSHYGHHGHHGHYGHGYYGGHGHHGGGFGLHIRSRHFGFGYHR